MYDQNQAFTNVTLGPNNVPVKCKLDNDSQVNVIPISTYKQLGITDQLSPSSDLSGYAGSPLRTLGSCKVSVGVGDKVFDTYFHVVDPDGRHAPPILGLSSCMTMGFVKFVNSVTVNSSITDSSADSVLDRETVLTQFKDVFEGLGLFPWECTIHVESDAIPAVYPPRRVPQALGDRVKTELDRMEKLQVITKVDTPTHWVNSMVVVEKPSGALRICLDPRDLNKVIHRPHYPLKTLSDILPELSGARYFTKLDARSGYWTIKLDNDSSYLTTFNSPYGRYRFLRLPFGLKSAQDEFQRKID